MYGASRKELSGGFKRTTNNRMELYAAISSLELLKEPCQVELYSDSRYLVDAINLGWVYNWRAKNWKRSGGSVPNADLWQRLLVQLEKHQVLFSWVEGHAGVDENERCDQISNQAARGRDLPVDEGYEKGGRPAVLS
jgi:ribonuclease HI